MRKYCSLFLLLFSVIIPKGVVAQNSISFYHLGNTTFQHSYFNPAVYPAGKIFVGIPALSGIHVNVNSRLSYNNLTSQENQTSSTDLDKAFSNMNNQNTFTVGGTINVLHLGLRLDNGMVLSFGVRERIEADVLYSKDIMGFFIKGNLAYLGKTINLNQAGSKVNHYREYAFGGAMEIFKHLKVGGKVKLLNGMLDVSTPFNPLATVTTKKEAFQLQMEFQNAQLRTSGEAIYQGDTLNIGSHLAFNGNIGVGLDLGFQYNLMPNLSISGSVLDLGVISWKENIKNYQIKDQNLLFEGSSSLELSNLTELIEDSLLSKLTPDTLKSSYSSFLSPKAYLNVSSTQLGDFELNATIGARLLQKQVKMIYGLGISRDITKRFKASISAVKMPQQPINAGAALSAMVGPVQLYMAADNIINFSVPDAKAIDFRFGINLVFGMVRPNTKGSGAVPTTSFLGSEVKLKGKERVYSIIGKQKKRKLRRNICSPKQSVELFKLDKSRRSKR